MVEDISALGLRRSDSFSEGSGGGRGGLGLGGQL